VLPPLTFTEALRHHEDAGAKAGSYDRGFFHTGWSEVLGSGNVQTRVTTSEGALSFRLPEVGDYPATLRLDPFPRPLHDRPQRSPVVEVILNGSSIANVPLKWSPDRVGAYEIVLPHTAVRPGNNVLKLRILRAPEATAFTRPGLTEGDAVALWYVRVHPPPVPGR